MAGRFLERVEPGALGLVEFVKSKGYMYREADIGDDHLKRLFVKDPNGATIELAFLMDKATGKELMHKPDGWYQGAKLYELDEAERARLDAFKETTGQKRAPVPAE